MPRLLRDDPIPRHQRFAAAFRLQCGRGHGRGMGAAKKKKAAAPKKATRARRTKPKVDVLDAEASALAISAGDPALATVASAVEADGGAPIGAWRDPLGGHPLLLATLPIDKVAPTSFQRDV